MIPKEIFFVLYLSCVISFYSRDKKRGARGEFIQCHKPCGHHSRCSIHQTCGLANWLRIKMIPREFFLSYIFHVLLVCTAEIKMRSPWIVCSTPQALWAPLSVLNPPDMWLS